MFDVTLSVLPPETTQDRSIVLALDYNTSLFEKCTAKAMVDAFVTIAERAATSQAEMTITFLVDSPPSSSGFSGFRDLWILGFHDLWISGVSMFDVTFSVLLPETA